MTTELAGFETVLCWDALGRRIRKASQVFESPYHEPATIIEGECGLALGECFGCGAFREDVRDTPVEFFRRTKTGELVDREIAGADGMSGMPYVSMSTTTATEPMGKANEFTRKLVADVIVRELQPWALRRFERAYERSNRREKCSRSDFYAGYRAALIDLKAWSQFRMRPDA